MDSDQGKLFIGGISWETTEETLREYFIRYGEVADVVIMRDRSTGSTRGFGFVAFADPNVVDTVLKDKHIIAGRAVEAKRALPRSEQQPQQNQGFGASRSLNAGPTQGFAQRTRKIFVGGLPATLTEDEFRKYFEQFGNITDVVVMYDSGTQRPRGFGFITFDSEDAVEAVVQKSFHELHDKLVEVKRAVPKEGNTGSRGRGFGGYGSNHGGGNYGRMDNNRYGNATAGAGRGYAGYGPTGYAAPAPMQGNFAAGGYMNGGYGGGGYGSPGGGYGYGNVVPAAPSPSGGYGGGPAVGGYGNGPVGAPRSPWGGAGFGPNSAGYGANPAAAYVRSGGAQSPSAAGSYGGAPAYLYGDGAYSSGGTPVGYGRGGGAAAPAGGPYTGTGGSSYGDSSHGTPGYSNTAWKQGGNDHPSSGVGGFGGYSSGGGDGTTNEQTGYEGAHGASGRQSQRGPDSRFRPYPDRTG
ncbi:hypothetical protein SUGI_0908520 [Cryptomeria japonica]|uniref:heterogeneous nuclear ribonucleoprotein 1 n=1 Tax=Cryptomeria japonica TaxID=3369 RepID=UPI0024146D49|nr:heterogeneous nuclear ribonucleoprotein 1 [Cryptomeria japonica]GLJ43642.1 hypothetical protein SUGI_0908520 [Cryptomeria japonica]